MFFLNYIISLFFDRIDNGISFQSRAAAAENGASLFIFLVFAKDRKVSSSADQRQRAGLLVSNSLDK